MRASIRLLGVAGALAAAAPAAAVEVALLPVVVHSQDAQSAYLSAGLASMLSSRLSQFEQIRVVRVDAATAPTAKLADAIEAGRSAGADFVVFGSFTQFGQGASLDLQCARVAAGPDDAARRVFIQAGALGDIIPKLDELAGKIRLYVTGGAGPGATAAPAAAGGADTSDLSRRVDALERAVYGTGQQQGPAAPPRPPPPAGAKDAPVR
jgi:TolB-like protein